jgi:hypothetical protein
MDTLSMDEKRLALVLTLGIQDLRKDWDAGNA